MGTKGIEELMEPAYNKELVGRLCRALSEKLPDAGDLFDSGYIEHREGGEWTITPTGYRYLEQDFPDELSAFKTRNSESLLSHLLDDMHKRTIARVEKCVEGGELIHENGVYHITERGHRVVSRFFIDWLLHRDPKSTSSPHFIELIYLDGATDKTVVRKYNTCPLQTEYYWRHLRKVLLETLPADTLAALGRPPAHPRKPKIPSWCADVIADGIQDRQDERAGVNVLRTVTWGRNQKRE